ncbi:MAG: diaminopimelate decarboxylase [Clostridiales bacterium]|jgi:diaminopimelate decarboxylase|nr:diaminopimelate decarboxylase [Clostridiales bacterium]
MIKLNGTVTDGNNFFENTDPFDLIAEYGSPLYVYNERLLRENCRLLKNFCPYPQFQLHYSVKANANLSLLRIIREEGLRVDAMSPGEIVVEQAAGFSSGEILFVSNNISDTEMQFVHDKGILMSVDSVSQLERYATLFPDSEIFIRFNTGIGAGHHEKVVTGGKNTKFGVTPDAIPAVKDILRRYNIRLKGINQHIGSLFLEKSPYMESVESIFEIARQFDDLDFIDFGGGFGVPYHKQEGQGALDFCDMGQALAAAMKNFSNEYGKQLTYVIEPGRFVVCEAGVLIGTVHAIKENHGTKYVGTDLGLNTLMRPAMYDAFHDVEVYRATEDVSAAYEAVTITGNICETGDILAKNRLMPEIFENDLICVLDAGAYGYSMASNYTCRLRPAEYLITGERGRLIRRRDTFDDILAAYV